MKNTTSGEFDFGFSFEDDQVGELTFEKEKVSDEKTFFSELAIKNAEACVKMYDKIDTLLLNLEKNPSQEMIRWPNRAETIQNFRKELQALLPK